MDFTRKHKQKNCVRSLDLKPLFETSKKKVLRPNSNSLSEH